MSPDQTTTPHHTDATLDVSDLDQYMGVPMRPGELKEPVARNDIRRWAQAMHYPNHCTTTSGGRPKPLG